MIVHVGNCIVLDDIAFGKTHPDAVYTIVHVVANDLIAGAKAQLDGILHNVVDMIARDHIVIAAGQAVRFDKNTVAIAAAHFVI